MLKYVKITTLTLCLLLCSCSALDIAKSAFDTVSPSKESGLSVETNLGKNVTKGLNVANESHVEVEGEYTATNNTQNQYSNQAVWRDLVRDIVYVLVGCGMLVLCVMKMKWSKKDEE